MEPSTNQGQKTSSMANPFGQNTQKPATTVQSTTVRNPFGQPTESVTQEKPQVYKNPFQMASSQKKEPVSRLPQSSGNVNNNSPSTVIPNPFQNEENKPGQPKEEPRKSIDASTPEGGPSDNKSAIQKLESLGFRLDEIIPGETLVMSIKCKVMLIQYPSVIADGVFVITSYRLMFKPADDSFFKRYPLKRDYLKIPLGFLHKIERNSDKKNLDIIYLDIHSKDGRILRLRIVERGQNESGNIIQYSQIYGFPDKKEYFFAFEYSKESAARELEDKYQGWKLYDIEREFKRQGIDFTPVAGNPEGVATKNRFRIMDNRYFRACATYPPLLLVPTNMSDQAVLASSRFRTKERLPAITYYYKKKGTFLSRCSQSKTGITQNRCPEDEILLRYLGDANYDESQDNGNVEVNLSIYDARPYLNAMAQKVNGKGFEDTKLYRNCEINFMDIDNIHHVREAHRKILNLCYSPDFANNKWYSQLEATNWLELASFIITAASKVAQSLRNGRNCLVHCSDGWDRTAQILCLAQIMLDPYFRTIEGFEVLIMKEWVSFGHQFSTRMGHGNKNDKDDQRSPVFLQFLDCVHQLISQYPFAFEFNLEFLTDIAYHAYACRFGTFLCNTYQEVVIYQLETRTISLWSYLNSQKEKYLNPFYDTVIDHSNLILRPSSHLKYLRLWEEYFLYYSWLSKPNYNLSEKISFCKDFSEYMYAKEKRKGESLRGEVERLLQVLKDHGIDESEIYAEKENRKSEKEEEAPIPQAEEGKIDEEEEVEVLNLEGEKDQSRAKEAKEISDVKVIEKDGQTEFVGDQPKNEDVQNLGDDNDDGEGKDDDNELVQKNE